MKKTKEHRDTFCLVQILRRVLWEEWAECPEKKQFRKTVLEIIIRIIPTTEPEVI